MRSCCCAFYAKTQNLTLQSQLNSGIRVLDLRVGDEGPSKGDNRYIFIHGSTATAITVNNGLNQIRRFLDDHPNEFVFLDFHRVLSRYSGEFDFEGLANLVDEILGPL